VTMIIFRCPHNLSPRIQQFVELHGGMHDIASPAQRHLAGDRVDDDRIVFCMRYLTGFLCPPIDWANTCAGNRLASGEFSDNSLAVVMHRKRRQIIRTGVGVAGLGERPSQSAHALRPEPRQPFAPDSNRSPTATGATSGKRGLPASEPAARRHDGADFASPDRLTGT